MLEQFSQGLGELFGKENVVSNFTIDRGVPTRMLNREIDNGFFALFPGVKSLHKQSSEYQTIEVLEHPWFGRALILDNVIQFSSKFRDV